MKKTLFVLMLACLSNFAFADYFGCELKITGENRIDVEAEYRGREVSVSHKGWTCEAVIDGNIVVHVNLKSPQLNATSSVSDRASATTGFGIQNPNDEEGEFIFATCTCGLR